MTAVVPFPVTAPDVADLAYRNALADLRRHYPEGCWRHLETVLLSYGAFVSSLYDTPASGARHEGS